jgi:hypothetical protein
MVAEADLTRAKSILATLEQEPAHTTPAARSWRWQRPALKLLAASVALSFLSAANGGKTFSGVK